MPSFRLALSPRDCSSISLSLPPSLSGTRSGPGCEPFALASRHRNLSSQTPCARHFPIFSWLPQKPILSRNSSPIGRTRKICGFSAWLRDQKDGLLSADVGPKNPDRHLDYSTYSIYTRSGDCGGVLEIVERH